MVFEGVPQSIEKFIDFLIDFGLHFGLPLDSLWAPFGLPLASLWAPNLPSEPKGRHLGAQDSSKSFHSEARTSKSRALDSKNEPKGSPRVTKWSP